MFYNYSSEKFTYTWGNTPYTFEPGGVYDGIIISDDKTQSLQLNDITSRFFSKHLAEKLLNENKSVGKDPLKYNLTNMDMLIERGVNPPNVDKQLPDFASELKIESKPSLEVVTPVIKDEFEEKMKVEEPKKKMGRQKKIASPSPEAQFEGIEPVV